MARTDEAPVTKLSQIPTVPKLRYIELCAQEIPDEDIGWYYELRAYLYYGEVAADSFSEGDYIGLGELDAGNPRAADYRTAFEFYLSHHEQTWGAVADVLQIPLKKNDLWEQLA